MKFQKKFLIIISLIFVFSSQIFSQQKNKKPKVALVLSGGGAKGLAEIPLLEELERMGIKPDIVLGTSMGSLIGALYSAGYTPKEIKDIMLSLNFIDLLSEPSATQMKPSAEAFNFRNDARLSLSFAGGSIGSAPGVVGEQKIISELNYYLSNVLTVKDFDHLPIPFRAVGTNVSTGEPVVFKDGSLVQAVRGSISIPLLFTPAVEQGDIFVMDGGLRDNMPVRLAKKLGADYVIAIDVASVTNTDPKTLSNLYAVSIQFFNLLFTSNAVEQYEYADLLLKPELDEFTIFDFIHPKEIYEAGKICVEKNKASLEKLAATLKKSGFEFQQLDEERKGEYKNFPDLYIEDIQFKTISFSNEESLIFNKKTFEKFKGRKLDSKTKRELERKLYDFKTNSHLSSFTYTPKKGSREDSCILELTATNYVIDTNKIFFTPNFFLNFSNAAKFKNPYFIPESSFGIYFAGNVETELRYSYGDTHYFDADFFFKIFTVKNMKVGIEFTESARYGSLQYDTNTFLEDRLPNDDFANYGRLGLELKYSDFYSLKGGIQYSLNYLTNRNGFYNFIYNYNELSFSTLRNDFSKLNGTQAEIDTRFGRVFEKKEMPKDTIIFIHGSFEKRFELLHKWNSIGFKLEGLKSTFPSLLNESYADFGGINGMSGCPIYSLRKEFTLASISFRQKIFDTLSMPLYLVAKGDLGYSEEIIAGGSLYASFKTPFGSFILGGGYNTSKNWCVTIGFN